MPSLMQQFWNKHQEGKFKKIIVKLNTKKKKKGKNRNACAKYVKNHEIWCKDRINSDVFSEAWDLNSNLKFEF